MFSTRQAVKVKAVKRIYGIVKKKAGRMVKNGVGGEGKSGQKN